MSFNELNSVENYIIHQLTGVNLNEPLVADRKEVYAGNWVYESESEFEKAFRPTAGQKITLKEVLIERAPSSENSYIALTDSNGKKWYFFFGPYYEYYPWDFHESPTDFWKNFRDSGETPTNFWEKAENKTPSRIIEFSETETSTDQKTLSEVLKQKLAQQKLGRLTTALTTLKTKLSQLAQALGTFGTLSNASGA